jgi:iron(III) transport system ATP-binding protein
VRIVIHELRKSFQVGHGQVVTAVDDLSMEVDDGELLVILGPSGSGKTTLLRCIAGLERADSGDIVVDDQLVYSSSRRVWVPPERRGISMVFQSYALWPHMTAFDNVAYPLRARGISTSAIQARVSTAFGLVGCNGLERRRPNELSGGQQQRIAIARAVVGGSRVVLFDEPLSSVDARVREELRRELVALQRELGFSAVYITHDQTEAMAIGHRVAVLTDGRIAQVASPRELYGRPASGAVAEFMGATNRLSGVVESVQAAQWYVRTELGSLRVAPPPLDVQPTGAVTLIVRPEDYHVGVAPPRQGTVNTWPCTVEGSQFLGFCTEYLVRVHDRVVWVRSTDKRVLEHGASAWLTVEPADVRVVGTP